MLSVPLQREVMWCRPCWREGSWPDLYRKSPYRRLYPDRAPSCPRRRGRGAALGVTGKVAVVAHSRGPGSSLHEAVLV